MVGVSGGGVYPHDESSHNDRVRKLFAPVITGTGTMSVKGATLVCHLDTVGDYALGLINVPEDFVSAVAIWCVGADDDVFGGDHNLDCDFYLDVQHNGNLYDADTRSNLNQTWVFVNYKQNVWKSTGLDVTGLAKGDILGLSAVADEVDILIYGWVLEYNAEE